MSNLGCNRGCLWCFLSPSTTELLAAVLDDFAGCLSDCRSHLCFYFFKAAPVVWLKNINSTTHIQKRKKAAEINPSISPLPAAPTSLLSISYIEKTGLINCKISDGHKSGCRGGPQAHLPFVLPTFTQRASGVYLIALFQKCILADF